MRRLVPLVLLASACAPGGPAPLPAPDRPTAVVLVSLDGFHPDYLHRGVTPALDSMAREGVRAEWMQPSFPTKTFPNHYTLVTGLRPDRHGIIANTMWDDSLGAFSMSRRDAVRDARWWGGEPIWVTAERQGRRAGALFWPGSEARIRGHYASHWMPFDDEFPEAARVDSVLAWLDVPAERRPVFMTLYYSNVDHAGHDHGPQAPEVDAALARVDSMVARLGAGLAARGLADEVNVIVVADHGMAATSRDRLIAIDDYISMNDVRMVDWNPVAMIAPKPGRETAVYHALKDAHPHATLHRRDEVPARLEFGTHARVPALVWIADDGWTITTRERFASFEPGGNHGYDNALPSMRALFVAAGPAFRRGAVVPPFGNIHVYELMAHIAGLVPAPNQGSLDSVRVMLR